MRKFVDVKFVDVKKKFNYPNGATILRYSEQPFFVFSFNGLKLEINLATTILRIPCSFQEGRYSLGEDHLDDDGQEQWYIDKIFFKDEVIGIADFEVYSSSQALLEKIEEDILREQTHLESIQSKMCILKELAGALKLFENNHKSCST